MSEIHVAPYKTMRVVYNHFDMGKKGRMDYRDSETGKWIPVQWFDDYADTMLAFHNEIAKHVDK